MEGWKVGEIARRTGLTVRALHHYEAIGLLAPSRRTRTGHRLYGVDDLERLQKVVSLRQLGLPLEEVRRCLDEPGLALREVLSMQMARLEERIEEQRRLHERLQGLVRGMADAEPVSAEELLLTIEATIMHEKYYSREQLDELEQRRLAYGEEKMRAVEAEWPTLIAGMRAEMAAGTDPADERVQALARRWQELVREFTGGNPEIARSLGTMYRQEPQAAQKNGLDAGLMEYVARANRATDRPE